MPGYAIAFAPPRANPACSKVRYKSGGNSPKVFCLDRLRSSQLCDRTARARLAPVVKAGWHMLKNVSAWVLFFNTFITFFALAHDFLTFFDHPSSFIDFRLAFDLQILALLDHSFALLPAVAQLRHALAFTNHLVAGKNRCGWRRFIRGATYQK